MKYFYVPSFFLHFLKLFFPSQTETGAQILRLRSPFQVKLQVLLDINGIDISVWNLFPSIGGTTAAPRQMLAALNTEYKVKITKYHHLARSGLSSHWLSNVQRNNLILALYMFVAAVQTGQPSKHFSQFCDTSFQTPITLA